jgi:hypothetical protein
VRAKIPQEVNDAFSTLAPNRDFQKLLGWLKEELQLAREANDYLEGISLTRTQGECTVLAKVIKTAEEAD